MTDPLPQDAASDLPVEAAAATETAPIEQQPVAEAEAPAPVAEAVEEVASPEPVFAEPEPAAPPELVLPVAEAAPIMPSTPAPTPAAESASSVADGLPLQFLNDLLRRIGLTDLSSLNDLVPILRILSLAVVAGIALKLTSATLGAINDLPLVGGLLELVGLVAFLNFLARNAFKQQKRAELLARIQKIKTDLLG